MKKLILALLAAAAGGAALYFMTKHPARAEVSPHKPVKTTMPGVSRGTSAKGKLALSAEADETGAVTVKAVAELVSGTPPVDVFLDVQATTDGQVVMRRSTQCTLMKAGETCILDTGFLGKPGTTYTITATATFRNRWGQDVERATKTVTVPGQPPKGELEIVVRGAGFRPLAAEEAFLGG